MRQDGVGCVSWFILEVARIIYSLIGEPPMESGENDVVLRGYVEEWPRFATESSQKVVARTNTCNAAINNVVVVAMSKSDRALRRRERKGCWPDHSKRSNSGVI